MEKTSYSKKPMVSALLRTLREKLSKWSLLMSFWIFPQVNIVMLVCHRTVYISLITTLIFENQSVELIHLRTISLIDVSLPGIVYRVLLSKSFRALVGQAINICRAAVGVVPYTLVLTEAYYWAIIGPLLGWDSIFAPWGIRFYSSSSRTYPASKPAGLGIESCSVKPWLDSEICMNQIP